ncbi:MAG: hypothetical protein K5880_09535 [Hydrogenophaga sp.]|jgi:protein-disulfide isomerase|uniref:DsbA family protein n=1 Tax=Hydrogenophaga sp. TaxID=1904254 RepID=UPI0026369E2F|nr:DsbA family protein [Hydrogenophaga sp.]MCV0438863.1 hypothetical protein [Hydrogenophaga sp.]
MTAVAAFDHVLQLLEAAREQGRFETTLDALLSQAVIDLKAIGVRSTPTFFVNVKPLASTDPDQLDEMVKHEVAQFLK